jgi:CheY-like chemotaxis protein
MGYILLLEDSEDMLETMTEALELYGHEVVGAMTGHDGLIILENNAPLPDLIISDVTMPILTGMDVLRAVRGNPRLANIPVALMSGRIGDRTEAIECGATAFLSKPFRFSEVEQLLSATFSQV